ncbi:hypothetical protein PR048_011775 [Dryococelus australis]|uniref:C2H2-type domain-containing protein n=1 Tax=Dryococelus australis TaxID=614101 RepID=A0ABQ9HMV2_9NEOP|nr:hypothetical protein PR048_011775 [Dryococelus australis]
MCQQPAHREDGKYSCQIGCAVSFETYAGIRQHEKRAHVLKYNRVDMVMAERRITSVRPVPHLRAAKQSVYRAILEECRILAVREEYPSKVAPEDHESGGPVIPPGPNELIMVVRDGATPVAEVALGGDYAYLDELLTKFISGIAQSKEMKPPKRRKGWQNGMTKIARSKKRAAKYDPAAMAARILDRKEAEIEETPPVEAFEAYYLGICTAPQHPTAIGDLGDGSSDIHTPITEEEVERVLHQLKDRAVGPDGIARDDLRKVSMKDLLAVYNIMWGFCLVPAIL